MERQKFEDIVMAVIANMPAEFRDLLDNVDICVEDWPDRNQLKKLRMRNRYGLLGLYEGIPLTERGQNYNLVLPDRITIFQKPLESQCHSIRSLKMEIEHTVKHEIAHHFGISDDRLNEIEKRV